MKKVIVTVSVTFFICFIFFGIILFLMNKNFNNRLDSIAKKSYIEGQNSLLIGEVESLQKNYYTLSERIQNNMSVLSSTIIDLYNRIDKIRNMLNLVDVKLDDLELVDNEIYEVLSNINSAFSEQYDAFTKLYNSFTGK